MTQETSVVNPTSQNYKYNFYLLQRTEIINPNSTKKKRRRGWTPGRLETDTSRTDSSIFTMKAHFLNFSFFFISCPLLFQIQVFLFSCLGSPRASRHAFEPTALGDEGVPSGFLFDIRNPFKIHLEQKRFTKKFNSPSILNRKSL